ncbi:DUF1062 domain-containing protein [Clostridium botulinum]|nr:DUF1062 domain-containing protein [Clostridium botulinum]
MSYLKKYQWELVLENLPIVKRNYPKCNEKIHYINSGKFRVNANKNNIDIWLIYQCEKCKSTWNMTIYNKNKAEVILEDINYKLIQKNLGIYYINENELVIEIVCKYPIELRVDKLLSDKLGISRSKIKNMHKI